MSTLTVRKLNVDLSRGFERYWMGGNVYRTAFMNALSMTFPLGEQLFVDSVRGVAPERIADPLLRAEVRDFVGQEASHRHVHLQYNAELARQGYPFTLEAALRRRIARIGRLTVHDRLAITCALEHYTAVLADYVLRHPDWLKDAEPQMRLLWSWHAAEETEHKGVAFDVYRAAGGGYARRVRWFLHTSAVFWWDIFLQTAHNLRRDRKLLSGATWREAGRAWLGRQGLLWHLLPPVLRYLAPRFHPWQHDNRALLELWLAHNGDAYRKVRSTPP